MRDLMYVLFFAGLTAVPAGFLLLPRHIGIPVALVGAVVLQISHYRLGQLKKRQEPPADSDVLDDGLFFRHPPVEED